MGGRVVYQMEPDLTVQYAGTIIGEEAGLYVMRMHRIIRPRLLRFSRRRAFAWLRPLALSRDFTILRHPS